MSILSTLSIHPSPPAVSLFFCIDEAQVLVAMALMGVTCGLIARWGPQRQTLIRWVVPAFLMTTLVAAMLIVSALDPLSRRLIGQQPASALHITVPAFLHLAAMLMVFVPLLALCCTMADGFKLYGKRDTLATQLPRMLLPVAGCVLLGWLGMTLGDLKGPVRASVDRASGVLISWPWIALMLLTALHTAWLMRAMANRGLSRVASLLILIMPTIVVVLLGYALFVRAAGDGEQRGQPAAHELLGATPGEIMPQGVVLLRWTLSYIAAVTAMAVGGVVGLRTAPRPSSTRISRIVIEQSEWNAPTPATPPAAQADPAQGEGTPAGQDAVQAALLSSPRHRRATPTVDPTRVPLYMRPGFHVVLWHALAAWILLYPFNFRDTAHGAFLADPMHGVPNFAGNILLFLPCGVVAGWWMRERRRSVSVVMLFALALGAAVSLLGEGLQLWLPERLSSSFDLVANAAGSAIGAALAWRGCERWERKRRRLVAWLDVRTASRHAGWAIIAVTALWLAPFDFSPELSDLRRGWERALNAGAPLHETIHWMQNGGAFQGVEHEWVWQVLPSVAIFTLLAVMLGRAIRGSFERRGDWTSPVFFILMLGGTMAAVLELLQWLVLSRTMDATGLVSSLTGVVLGALIDLLMGPVYPHGWSPSQGYPGAPAEPTEHPPAPSRADLSHTSEPQPAEIPERPAQEEPPRRELHGEPAPVKKKEPPLTGSGDTTQTAGGEAPAPAWSWVPTRWGVAGCVLLAVLGSVAVRLPGVPYNWPKLVRGPMGGAFAMLGITLSLLVLGGAPAAAARWMRWSGAGARWWGAWITGTAAGAAIILIATTPDVMVAKITGAPVWGLAYYLESFLRLTGLLLGPVAALTAATTLWDRAVTGGDEDGRRPFGLALWTIAAALACRTVVVTWACTDNITELLAGGGDPANGLTVAWPGEMWLALTIALLTANATLVAVLAARRRIGPVIAVAVATLPAAVVGFLMFNLGTVHSFHKYDVTFSAAQFLLGANRSARLSDASLLARWCVLYYGVVTVLAFAGTLGYRSIRGDTRREGAAETTTGTAGLVVLAVVFSGLLIYGSLVPLALRPMPLASAVEKFNTIMQFSRIGASDRYDWVTNALLFGAAAFLWMAALAGERWSAAGLLLAGAAAWTGVVVMGTLLEFMQLFTADRITSPGDVAAQAVGAAAAIGLFALFGRSWTAPLRRLIAHQARDPLSDVLLLYLAGYVLYAVMPLDLAVSATELRSKWDGGLIVLRPFGFQWKSAGEAAWVLGGDVLLAIPVGALLGRWFRVATGRPLLIGLAILAGIELSHLPPMSRVVDVTHILMGMIGVALGVAAARKRKEWWLGRPTGWYRAAAAVYALALWVGYTAPWNFSASAYSAGNIRDHLLVIPFTGLHAGSSWVALDQILRKTLLGLPLGLLIAQADHNAGRRRRLQPIGLAACACWMLLIESAQLGIADRVADSTDAFLGTLGVAGGMLVARLVNDTDAARDAA
ncbi:MAG: VanZ family protein [Planctomycetes bacterium]|nr:VanZ family protein [Planctomycetota bacterium]